MQNSTSSELFNASIGAFQGAIEQFGRLLHMLPATGTTGPDWTAGSQALQKQLVKELEIWLSASHPLTGWMSAALRQVAPGVTAGVGPTSSPAEGDSPFSPDQAFAGAAAAPQAQLAHWFRLQSQLMAHWNTIAQEAGASFARRVGQMNPAIELADVRKLYNVWIDCAEEAYAQTAHSEAFSRLISELINTAMAMRLQAQQHLQSWAGAAGLPTRAELEALQRQVAELESGNSRLRQRPNADSRVRKRPTANTRLRQRLTANSARGSAKKRAVGGSSRRKDISSRGKNHNPRGKNKHSPPTAKIRGASAPARKRNRRSRSRTRAVRSK